MTGEMGKQPCRKSHAFDKVSALATLVIAAILISGCIFPQPVEEKPTVTMEFYISSSRLFTQHIQVEKGTSCLEATMMTANNVKYGEGPQGVTITSIGGFDSSEEESWVFYINGTEPSTTIDRCRIYEDTTIMWRLKRKG